MPLRFLEIAFAEASQGIMAVSADNTICLANRSAHATFLYAPGELVGQSIDRVLPEPMGRADFWQASG